MSKLSQGLLSNGKLSGVGGGGLSVEDLDPFVTIVQSETLSMGYTLKTISVSNQGTKMYTADTTMNLREYTMATKHDLSTASLTATFPAISAASPVDMQVSSNGKYLYYATGSATIVYYRQFGTAWDVSTLGVEQSKSVGSVADGGTTGVFVMPDGNSMYVTGYGGGVYHSSRSFALSTPYDPSTATQTSRDAATYTSTPSINVMPKEEYVIIGGGISYRKLSTAGDLTTGSIVSAFKFDSSGVSGRKYSDDYLYMYFVNGTAISKCDTSRVGGI